jgi:membrane protease YdiL (CAAX protease family)
MKRFIANYPVLVFVLLTLGYQFGVVGVVKAIVPEGAHLHDSKMAWMVFRMRVFGPLVFAVALTWYLERGEGLRKLFGAFLHWRVPAKWYALGFGWKFLFTYVGVGALVLVGLRVWPGWVVHDFFGGDFSNLKHWLSNLGFIIGIAFVEETAWMKFCVTRMQQRWSALASCLIIGVAWGLWYLPMLLINEGVPDGYPWHMFLLSMVALTILLGWTYNMTHSGTILLIMQVISNCAFFIIPVLPAWWNGDATYINAFVGVNILSAITLVLVYGWRELGTGRRARWDEIGKEGSEEEKDVPEPEMANA